MIFQVLPLLHFNRYKRYLWTCSFLAKNLFNFVSQAWNSTISIAIGSTRCFKIIQIGTCWLNKTKNIDQAEMKKKNAALCFGNVLVKLTLKIHFIIWHLEQYIDEIFIILPAGRVCHFSLVMLPLYFVWQLFIWLCCWLLQQVAGWLKISELEKSVCFRVSNFSTYRSIWTHFGFYTSVLELTHYMYCVNVDQFRSYLHLICCSERAIGQHLPSITIWF